MTSQNANTPQVRQAFDPMLLDVLQWGPLDVQERDPAVRDALKAAVDRLPALECDVVNAMFWEGLSRRQIGRRLGVSRATVNNAYLRALELLGEMMEESE